MKKKFYELELTHNTKIVGCYPQVKSFYGAYDKHAEDSVYNTKWNHIPDFELNIGQLELRNKAKMTDFISTFLGGNAPLLSDKVLDILKAFQLPKHKIVPVPLFKNEVLLTNYNRFFYESRVVDLLDLNQCEFIKPKRDVEEIFKVQDIKSLRKIDRDCLIKGIYIKQKRIVLQPEILEIDLFNFDFLSGTQISEELGDTLMGQNILGIDFKPVYYEIN